MASRIPTQAEYEMNEHRRALQQERYVDQGPLADRKDAQREFLEAMATNPAVVAERLGWMFDGNYGYGEMQIAKQIVRNPRLNRRAGLLLLVGIYEWQCPRRMGVDAWKKLTGPQKQLLDAALDVVIAEAEKEVE